MAKHKLVYVYVYGDPKDKTRSGEPAVVACSQSIGNKVVIDYDVHGDVFGIEIIDAGQVTVSNELMSVRRKLRDVLTTGGRSLFTHARRL